MWFYFNGCNNAKKGRKCAIGASLDFFPSLFGKQQLYLCSKLFTLLTN